MLFCNINFYFKIKIKIVHLCEIFLISEEKTKYLKHFLGKQNTF